MMPRFASIAAAAVLITSAGTVSPAQEKPAKAPKPDEPEHGGISVHLKGTLSVGTTRKLGADTRELSSASVTAGGMAVMLDWSHSEEVRKTLMWWSVPRHGDARYVQAEVTGRMEFRPAKEVGGLRQGARGIMEDTPVPVVIVESLRVRLVGPDGRPRGPQFPRPRRTR